MQDVDGKERKLKVAVRKLSTTDSSDAQGQLVRLVNATVFVQTSKSNQAATQVKPPAAKQKPSQYTFTFEHAFGLTANSQQVYQQCIHPLVQKTVSGQQTVCLLYRARQDLKDGNAANTIPLIQLAVRELLESLADEAHGHLRLFMFWVSYEKLSGDSLYDVLSGNDQQVQLKQRTDGVKVPQYTEVALNSPEELVEMLGEMNPIDTKSRCSVYELSLRNEGSLYGKIAFWETPPIIISKYGRAPSEIQSILTLFGDSSGRNMNEGRVRMESKHSKLGLLLKQEIKQASQALVVVDIDPAARFLEQTLAVLQLIKRQEAPITYRQNKHEVKSTIRKPGVSGFKPANKILIQETIEDEPRVNNNRKTLCPKQSLQLIGPKSLKQTVRPSTLRLYAQKVVARPAQPLPQNSQLNETKRLRNKTAYEVPNRPKKEDTLDSRQRTLAKVIRTEQEPYIKVAEESTWGGDTQPLHQYCKTEELIESTKPCNMSQQPQIASNGEQSIEMLLPIEMDLCESVYNTTVETAIREDLLMPSTFTSQFEWNRLIKQFDQWIPQKQQGTVYYGQAEEYLLERLKEEEEAVNWLHSQCVSKEVETVKGQMELINQIKENRGDCDPLTYMDTIQQAIELKLESLLKLKQQASTLRLHTGQLRGCQRKLEAARSLKEQCPFQDLSLEEESLL